MPFGKTSQTPVPKPHMVKTHAGLGNHKVVLRSLGAVRANATGHAAAPTNQPNTSHGSSKSPKR
jgi:hypothetical protein